MGKYCLILIVDNCILLFERKRKKERKEKKDILPSDFKLTSSFCFCFKTSSFAFKSI